jgi:hypothetical protein
MRYLILISFFVLITSCNKKDTSTCYICTTTYIVSTDSPVQGYPDSTSTDVEICDVSEEQIREFELANRGSDSAVIGGVTYSSSFSTKCVLRD